MPMNTDGWAEIQKELEWLRAEVERLKTFAEERDNDARGMTRLCEQRRIEIEQLKSNGHGDARQIHGQSEKIRSLELQIEDFRREFQKLMVAAQEMYHATDDSKLADAYVAWRDDPETIAFCRSIGYSKAEVTEKQQHECGPSCPDHVPPLDADDR